MGAISGGYGRIEWAPLMQCSHARETTLRIPGRLGIGENRLFGDEFVRDSTTERTPHIRRGPIRTTLYRAPLMWS
jgi:hypothetical protein